MQKTPLGLMLLFMIIVGSLVSPVSMATTTQTHMHAHMKSAIVNINQADTQALQSLKGIGAERAKAIIVFRKQHGHFTSIQGLTQVKGIGKKFVARLVKENPQRIEVKRPH